MKSAHQPLTADRVREALAYDPDTGVFTSRSTRAPRAQEGKIAGCVDRSTGYVKICLDGRQYYAHRLAWLYVHGTWPEIVDHMDMCRTNNRLANLREVNKALNMQNQRKALRRNKCGLLGVSPAKAPGSWRASIVLARRQIHLGTYGTPEQAHEAYVEAKRRLHPGCTL